LSGLSDDIYCIFCHTKTTFQLQNALDQSYETVEKALGRFSIDDWFDFQFVNGNSIFDQLHEFENWIYK